MVTKTAAKPVAKKAPVKKVAPIKSTTKPVEAESKQRGQKRDIVEEGRILKGLLGEVTINGEGVEARVSGIGEAASGITLDSGKTLDSTRAKMIILRHLASKAGQVIENVTPKQVVAMREGRHFSWAQIDAITGTPRSKTLSLYDEAKGHEGAWREIHLVSREGGEGIRPKSERPASVKSGGGGRAAVEGDPIFTGEESRDDVINKVEGKNITWNGSGKMSEMSFKAKVVSVTKVGKGKEGRVIQFNDGDKTRTVVLTSIRKVGGR